MQQIEMYLGVRFNEPEKEILKYIGKEYKKEYALSFTVPTEIFNSKDITDRQATNLLWGLSLRGYITIDTEDKNCSLKDHTITLTEKALNHINACYS